MAYTLHRLAATGVQIMQFPVKILKSLLKLV